MRSNRSPLFGRFLVALAATLSLCAVALATPADQASPRGEIARLPEAELRELTKLAFFWGMHPVGMYELRYAYTQAKSSRTFVGEGRMYWDRAPRTAKDKSVTTPNATTLYGIGFADLRREPMVVMTPAVPDRYFSLQACDQFPRWFFQVGNQFTGRGPQTHLIVGPDFNGPFPSGFAAVQVHKAPSNFALVLGRFALKSTEPKEIAAVNALMDQTTVVPLSVWLQHQRKPIRSEDLPVVVPAHATIPRMADLIEIAPSLTGLDLLQMVSLVLNDPTMTLRKDSAKEVDALGRLARLGLAPGVRFDPAWLSDAQKKAVEEAFVQAKRESARSAQNGYAQRNGWRLSVGNLAPDINDYVRQGYNGLTIIGAPIPARSHTGALGFVDAEGKPLDGVASRYTITFDIDKLPPVTEFWEMPIYDQNGYFVDNPLGRYSINSFMLERGDLLVENKKLVIYVQHDKPSDPKQARNWLPAPAGGFRMVPRFYGPMDGLLDGSYDMPGIVRAQ